jgi:hypothetical protein
VKDWVKICGWYNFILIKRRFMTNYGSWSDFDEQAELQATDERFTIEDFKDSHTKVSWGFMQCIFSMFAECVY